MFCLHHLQWEQTVASLHILASRFPFTKPQPFTSQPVLMCGVILPQAQNPKHFSLPNFRKFLLAQFHMSQSSSGLKLCHLGYQSLSLAKHHLEFPCLIIQISDEDIEKSWTFSILHLLLAFSWILSHWLWHTVAWHHNHFSSTLMLCQLENKNAVGGSVKNVTRHKIYSPHSLYSHGLFPRTNIRNPH